MRISELEENHDNFCAKIQSINSMVFHYFWKSTAQKFIFSLRNKVQWHFLRMIELFYSRLFFLSCALTHINFLNLTKLSHSKIESLSFSYRSLKCVSRVVHGKIFTIFVIWFFCSLIKIQSKKGFDLKNNLFTFFEKYAKIKWYQ